MNDVIVSLKTYYSKMNLISFIYSDESAQIKYSFKLFLLQKYPNISYNIIYYFLDENLSEFYQELNLKIIDCINKKDTKEYDELFKSLCEKLKTLYFINKNDTLIDVLTLFFENEINENKFGFKKICNNLIYTSFIEIIALIFSIIFYPVNQLFLCFDSS